MNKENILLVAAAIREHAANFSLKTYAGIDVNTVQEKWIGDHKAQPVTCNTCACVCGWANAINNVENKTSFTFADKSSAARFLGLSWDFAYDLFLPRTHKCDATPQQPWSQARTLGLLPPEKSAYDATAEEAASLLEAIANGQIELY